MKDGSLLAPVVASEAIGRAALNAGDRVVATARNLDRLRNILRGREGENLAFVQLDVADEAQAKSAVEQAVRKFGLIDVAVNHAGYRTQVSCPETAFADMTGT